MREAENAKIVPLLTVNDVAKILNQNPEYIRHLARSGGIPMFRIAGRGSWRISRETLEEWLKERQVNG